MSFLKLTEQNVNGKTVLIRADLNVPFKDGKISDDTRIRASLASIQHCLDNGAGVIVMSHLGRPTEGEFKPEDDVAPVAAHLGKLLGKDVKVLNDWQENKPTVKAGEVFMLQNVRINKGEKKNNPELGQAYASLCDVFVNDAFGTAHRAEASTEAVAAAAPLSCAGILMAGELDALGKALKNPARPLVAIVAGSKVSTKLTILESLADKVDSLIVGGGIANTCLLAKGKELGKSLVEKDLVNEAKAIMEKMEKRGNPIPLPVDSIVALEFSETAAPIARNVDEIKPEEEILDIGEKSRARLAEILKNAGTIVWNGPVGVFEFDNFAGGTKAVAEAIAASNAFSIAGGGDTLASISKFGVTDKISYISTGGGAFLEFLEGKELPAVAALEKFAK
ncbi:phosphoglycerate kinase [Kingella negevensis]|uniref:Phosphoglycerate kinase n=1 Tax=Kingella negevensis TaxID=1522312 RepID=A0A238HIC0_9NEIS|nr:phosphoglycerate kinase [Kingella negevensis]MDK4685351.1 phosphoglycerate kinase [Kingella negevensis]MDK4696551.1 phosphoglycerate kinase [Kingella negevensis]MDK4707427.1 phosphoglycerate kinase [Kingella negevensis]MDK4710097.1 phosphoglycerate kinase [Kingella negevensis]SNB77693.1 Phosphoglycerate kinase [Kingella negevensis]